MLVACGSDTSTSPADASDSDAGSNASVDGAADAPSSTPSEGGAPRDAAQPADAASPSDAQAPADSAPPPNGDASVGPPCASPGDCRLYSDNCGACSCVPLGTNDVDPVCNGNIVSCFVDPCQGKTAACIGGHCAAH